MKRGQRLLLKARTALRGLLQGNQAHPSARWAGEVADDIGRFLKGEDE